MGIHIAASKCPRVHAGVVESVPAALRAITGNGVNVLAMGAFYVAPAMGCDIADAYLGADLDSGYEWWYNFYEFHKLAIDELDATTLWEKWDGKNEGSHNHHMFSDVIAWFYKSLLGVAPNVDHPAFEEIELKPIFIKELGFVKGSMEAARGKIFAGWKYEDGKFIYTVDLPKGISASFGGDKLHAGKNVFTITEVV